MVKIYGFSADDCNRIKQTVRRFEDYYRTGKNAPARAKYPVAVPHGSFVPAACSAQIAAGTISAPVKFTATLYEPDVSGAGLVAGTTQVDGYNVYNSTIAANKLIWLTRWNDTYYVMTADC
jgi:hypothetical protein